MAFDYHYSALNLVTDFHGMNEMVNQEDQHRCDLFPPPSFIFHFFPRQGHKLCAQLLLGVKPQSIIPSLFFTFKQFLSFFPLLLVVSSSFKKQTPSDLLLPPSPWLERWEIKVWSGGRNGGRRCSSVPPPLLLSCSCCS